MPMRGDKLDGQSAHQAVVLCSFARAHRKPSDFTLIAAPDFRSQRRREQLAAETDAKDWLVGLEGTFDQRHLVAQVWISIELIDRLRTTHNDQSTEALDVLRDRMAVEDAHVLPCQCGPFEGVGNRAEV